MSSTRSTRTAFPNIGTFFGPAKVEGTNDDTGVGIGVGPTTGVGGAENTGLSVGINPGTGGTFAGFVVPGPDGTTDVSGRSS